MKVRTIAVAVLAVLALSGVSNAEFVQDEADASAPDTLVLEASVLPDAGSGQMNLQLDLSIVNDSNIIWSMSAGFWWDNPNLQMDSAKLTPVGDSSFNYLQYLYYKDNLASTNDVKKFMIAGVRLEGNGVPSGHGRNHLASYYFTLSEWNVGDSIVIDTGHFSMGTYYRVVSENYDNYQPYWAGPPVIYATPSSCCVGDMGNVDCDPTDMVDVTDQQVLIDHLFLSLTPLCCEEEADLDYSGFVDVTDLSIINDHLFLSLAPLGPCP
ncbi:MAG: hypothetical protein GY867_06045 [bacterium]|nr:hypothetical protein [bacterium]